MSAAGDGSTEPNLIAWADPDTHQVFHLYSESVTGEALLNVARSVVRND
jgi:hypothetical protein